MYLDSLTQSHDIRRQKRDVMARILIAEDDSSMRQFLSMALTKAGHIVEAREDGLAALEALAEGQVYDLLLADIVMPGMDGIELAQKAASLVPAMKVMFITGFAAVALDRKLAGEQQPKVMSKPFHLNDLVDQIEQILAV
jgi:two-component system cell cycle response regulator CpdR